MATNFQKIPLKGVFQVFYGGGPWELPLWELYSDRKVAFRRFRKLKKRAWRGIQLIQLVPNEKGKFERLFLAASR